MFARALIQLGLVLGLLYPLPPTKSFAADDKAGDKAAKIPVLLDTDIGTGIDDAFALAILAGDPMFDLRGVTTVAGNTETRAWIVCRFLTNIERREIPVAYGRGKQPERKITGQYQYRYHPSALFNRTSKPVKESATELLYQKLKADPGKVSIICTGPLTNIAALLKEHPDSAATIKSIVWSLGVPDSKAEGTAGEDHLNVLLDPTAAAEVLESGVTIELVWSEVLANLTIEPKTLAALFAKNTMLTMQLQTLYQLWNSDKPHLADAAILDPFNSPSAPARLVVAENKRSLKQVEGKPNSKLSKRSDKGATAGLDFTIARIGESGSPALPAEPKNRSKLIERGLLPAKVHAFEDYDTDIERRWWLTGKEETADVPKAGRRAIRGTLTLDFDDLQGNMKTMYNAVVFNPVPGPPMGASTRLSFRYKLRGTSTLRIQLYSLSNGYHRYLSLADLPQDVWQEGTVDMTQMRRPDGTGGPLSADERIDDIQFYVDPRAEVLIDDVVLYDAAPTDEKRPFPKRILYTGIFDTGKQGQEWAGDFKIAPHEKPRTWRYAKSVPHDSKEYAWIRLSLRGERILGEQANLRFQYQLTSADKTDVAKLDAMNIEIELRCSGKQQTLRGKLAIPVKDKWSEASLSFTAKDATSSNGKPTNEPMDRVDEIVFKIPKGAEIRIDDVLLWE